MAKKHWVEEIFEQCGALLTGHFVLASERHSGQYLEKALIFPYTRRVHDLCFKMTWDVTRNYPAIKVGAVVAPAAGGICLSQSTAHCLEFLSVLNHEESTVLSLFTEKDAEGKQVLKRGYQKLVAGKNVLVVDDILTTGKSIKEVIRAVEAAGGKVVIAAVLCNRGKVTSKDIGGYPLLSLWEKEIESWKEEECPLCGEGIPVDTEVGRGAQYLAEKSN